MQLHCLYVYLWFSEESFYLLPIRIAIALFFFYSFYSSLMSCTILRFVVQDFCINLGTLFLSEIILFPTWIKFSNFHKLHWLICSFIFILLLFFMCVWRCVYVSFCGFFFLILPPSVPSYPLLQSCLPGFSCLCALKTDVNYVPMIFLISMFSHNTCLHSGCRISVLQEFNRSLLIRRCRDTFSVAKALTDL